MAERLRLNQIRANIASTRGSADDAVRGARSSCKDRVTCVDQIELVPIKDLRIPSRRLRSASEAQVEALMKIIREIGFVVPLVTDEKRYVWSGIVRLKAARRLGLTIVPTVQLNGLTEAQKRAFRLADNKLPEKAKWDRKALALELPELTPLLIEQGLDISITGFSAVEIDQIRFDFEQRVANPSDTIEARWLSQSPISRRGDVYRLGDHVLCCGDARNGELVRRLVGNRLVAMAFLDPPYNVRIRDTLGRGKVKHSEFAMASGEMTRQEYIGFLEQALRVAASVSLPSAVHYVCIDWKHVDALIKAGRGAYFRMLNLAVWVKSNAGQGSFYRSQHELIGIFRVGGERHINNIELGRHGRSRSNVWSYPGVSGFRAGRMNDLHAHPTIKPTMMVCDAIKDCTQLDDTVLDTFCGSGTTILAAERVGRRAVAVETEPRFVDLAIRRWQDYSGKDAIHVDTGRSFNALTSLRSDGRRGQ